MNNNILDLVLRSNRNPEQVVKSMLQQQNTPLANNLLTLVQNNDNAGLAEVARNICAQRGVDFDKEFRAFRQKTGL